jgi:hypothetical protein
MVGTGIKLNPNTASGSVFGGVLYISKKQDGGHIQFPNSNMSVYQHFQVIGRLYMYWTLTVFECLLYVLVTS